MNAVLIFAGTTEGRELAELLSDSGICCRVCVATEYGKLVMPELRYVQVSVGRLDETQIRELLEAGYVDEQNEKIEYGAVVDATHPYATEVSNNIKESLNNKKVPLFRLKREENINEYENKTDIRYFASHEDCANALADTGGNILLTTGSKELSVYCTEALKQRLFVRILPALNNIASCEAQGIYGKQLIAMQGPFSREMNLAQIHQFDICCLVTKESGTNGGFLEKIQAAEEAGIPVCVIGQPKESGLSFSEVVEQLEKLLDMKISAETKVEVSMIGIGMGKNSMSIAAHQELESADLVFGAKRMLTCVPAGKEQYPYYQSADIISVLEEKRKKKNGRTLKAAVLLSGDTGFYSGAKKVKSELNKNGFENIRIFPGISSVSYLAAAVGESWEDAEMFSIHGRKDVLNWQAELLDFVMYSPKTFVLVSDVADISRIGKLLSEHGLGKCMMICGYQLSYEEEKIWKLPADEAASVTEQGLYTVLIQNDAPKDKILAPVLADSDFIRGQVPMSKEEIREIIVCKLGLTRRAVVFDLGSGTGSVAVECARRSPDIRVYAVDRKQEAVDLIKQNRAKHHLPNVIPVLGEAKNALQELETPTHVFIGGSGGDIQNIINQVWERNPKACVVATAVSLETVAGLMEFEQSFEAPGGCALNMETVQLQVSRSRHAGKSHLMQAENPVYIFRMKLMEIQEATS